MHFLQAVLLGIVQGATEFFPVSSSAHLKLARYFLGLPEGEEWLYFDLACHAGTWIALALFLRSEILQVLRTPRKIAEFSLALLPLIPAYFLLKPLKNAFMDPSYTGYFLLVTAALLFVGCRIKQRAGKRALSDVFLIGGMQALSILPGLSRSGSTIAMARLRGWSWKEGAQFSFLLAVPTILGAEIAESIRLPVAHLPFSLCAIGGISSFITGSLTVRWIFTIYERETVKPFAWYCIAVGCLMIAVWRG